MDNIPATLIEEICVPLVPNLSILYNSITTSKFPSILKLENVVQIYEAGASNDTGNCRPISFIKTA